MELNFRYKISILIISFLYAVLLVYILPMNDSINDRVNYLEYANSSDDIFSRYLSKGLISLLVNEPVWLLINIFMKFYFEPQVIVAIIIFFSAYTTSFLILKVNPKYFLFLLFMLVFPQVIGKFVVHLRQGFAIAFFLMGWFAISNRWRWLFFVLTPFIHASFFFVLFLLVVNLFFKKIRLAIDLRTVIVVFLAVIIASSLGYISLILGARQSNEYTFSMTDVSGLGFIFWLSILLLYWFEGAMFTRSHAFIMTVITFYLASYFLIEVTARIFESTVILVFLAGLELTSWRKKIFFIIVIGFILLSWLFRVNRPWLGWGSGV